MRRALSCCFVLALSAIAAAQTEPAKLTSGPQPGSNLPSAFDALTINGMEAGRQRCLVCDFGLDPAVLIFAREPSQGKDAVLITFLGKLDDTLAKLRDMNLKAGIVFLSPAARSSAYAPKNQSDDKWIEEAKVRTALVTSLTNRYGKLKDVAVSCYPDQGPKGWNIRADAGTTVIFYEKVRVISNDAFLVGQFAEADGERILEKVVTTLKAKKTAKKG